MNIEVNQRISAVRQEKKLNKKEFADELGIPSSIISDIENGKREPSKDFLHSLSVKYSISLNWLYFGVGTKSLVEAINEEKHPLITNIESLIKENVKGIEFRLSVLEGKFDKLSLLLENKPTLECPTESVNLDTPEFG